MPDALDLLLAKPIAHRGYHDATVDNHENSISAFQTAIDAGFGIECDLQVTSDRETVVFHDPVLNRMTTETGPVRHRTKDALSEPNLLQSNDKIHSLDEHLELTAGKVPLLLELKGIAGEDNGMVKAVAKSLETYKGPVALMSFNHWIVQQFADLIPERPRGLTAMGGNNFEHFHTRAMLDNDLHFVSYRVHDLPCKFITKIKNEHNKSVIAWTVRNQEQSDLSYEHADQITFEGYDPSIKTA
jgi:glycerophosphoryl diester phosphodiesterase